MKRLCDHGVFKNYICLLPEAFSGHRNTFDRTVVVFKDRFDSFGIEVKRNFGDLDCSFSFFVVSFWVAVSMRDIQTLLESGMTIVAAVSALALFLKMA